MELIKLETGHARDVAKLHVSGINLGFISSLGIDFVTELYEAIAQSNYSFGYVAIENERVIGFIAFTTNLNALYKSVVLKKGLRFAFLLARKMISWHTIKRIFETLFYPSRTKIRDLPKAELLSIAVSDIARGRGVATQLIRKGLYECANRDIAEVKVLVRASIEPANKLYIKCGFNFVGEIDSHGIISNIYVTNTSS
jgi:ribosomal protein S18 acetylase RimI-like enzyme